MTTETVVIELVTALPCAAWAGNAAGQCMKPATVAYGTPATQTGAWLFVPICPQCASAANAVYTASLATGDKLRAAYQTGDQVVIWQHKKAGDKYAVRLRDGNVTGAFGPLSVAGYEIITADNRDWVSADWDYDPALTAAIAGDQDAYRDVWPDCEVTA